MADIIYRYKDGIYFNLTNSCPCRCVFCIRDKKDAIGEAKQLFHETQPTREEIKKAIDSFDFSSAKTATFCGYGEPTCVLEELLFAADYVRRLYPRLELRLNTNGLSDLVNERATAKEICEKIPYISISLNEVTSEAYDKITRNSFPGEAFGAMLKFAKDCKENGARVRLSVVDVIGEEKLKKAKEIADNVGAEFLCRRYDT